MAKPTEQQKLPEQQKQNTREDDAYYCENSLLNICSTSDELKQKGIDSKELVRFSSKSACLAQCSIPKELTHLMLDYADNIDAYQAPSFHENTSTEEYKASKHIHDIKAKMDRFNLYLSRANTINLVAARLAQYENPRFILSQITEIKILWNSGKGFIGVWEVLETLFLLNGYAYRVVSWSKDIESIQGALREIIQKAQNARKNDRFNWFRLIMKLMHWRNHYSYSDLIGFFGNDCVPSDFYDAEDVASFGSQAYSDFVFNSVAQASLEWAGGPREVDRLCSLGNKISTKWQTREGAGYEAWESILSKCLPFNVTLDIWEFMLRKENRMWPFCFQRALRVNAHEIPRCGAHVSIKALEIISKIERESSGVYKTLQPWCTYESWNGDRSRVRLPTQALCESIDNALKNTHKLAGELAPQILHEYNAYFLMKASALAIKTAFTDEDTDLIPIANHVKAGGFAPMICNQLF